MSATITPNDVRSTVELRLKELANEPLVQEHEDLVRFRSWLDESFGHAPDPGANGHANGNGHAGAEAAKRVSASRKQRKGTLTERVAKIVTRHPDGISVDEIAQREHASRNYIYSVVRTLIEEGKVRREDGRVLPA